MSIQISDGIHNTKVWVLVQLRPVNEFDPTFTNPTINVNEIRPIGYEIMTYTADDSDAPPHDVTSYQILNVHNGHITTFYMDKTSGKIYLAQILDFESIPQYKIIVLATDGGGRMGTGTITINVENGNDHAPTCVTSVKSFTLSESAALGDVLMADFGCSDLDKDPLTYALTQVPTDNTFEVDNVSNQLRVKGALDYERSSFYSITIIVSDGSSSTRLKIVVNILNENEDAPQFLQSVISTVVSETDTNGKSVVTVSAIDADNDPVTYSFAGVYPNFRIDSKTGKILLRTSIDRETDPTIDLYVIASDGQRSSTATVSVTVEDVNETPIFANSSYRFTVAENTITGTDIGTVQAIDADVGPANGQVRYRILSGNDKSYFQIDNITGRITVATPIDYEDLETALLVVEASDLGSPTLSGVCTVSIQILDRNDNAPQFLSPTLQEQVPEDAPLGQSISQVFASDKDSSTDENNKVNYQSSAAVPFQVDSESGIVTVTGSLDRETIPWYQMVITATDRGTPRLTGSLTLEISLTDVNDNDPVVTGVYKTTVPENAPEHFVIFDINADDADGEAFGKLKYEIISGDSNSVFKIEPNTGVIQVASPLDRESISQYELVIKVTDNGIPPRSTFGAATIYVGDVNDVVPVSLNSSYEFSVLENVTINSYVGKIVASDGDFGTNSQLKYKIATYWLGSSGKFGINEMTGDIFTTGMLDREVEDVYSILFRVEDGGTPALLSDTIVNINVKDINDKHPMFRRPRYSTAIFENLAAGSKVHTTGATDEDLGVNAVIKYELDISTQNGLLTNYYFSVHETTGDIYLKRKVDREAYEMFTLTVVARDTGFPPLSSSVSVNIQIEDINDNRPKFSPLFYNTEASTINLCDATITDVTATDADLGRNAAVNYELDENAVSLPFTVSQLGAVKARSEVLLTKYIINVISRDNGDPVLTSSDHATVRIDRFRPEDVVVTFYLDMILPTFYQKETNLLRQVEEALSVDFPTVYVRRWCIEDKFTSILVHLYAVKNDVTNDISNLNVKKVFLTNGEFLDALQLNLNKQPTVEINGKTWNEYAVEKVVPYGDKIVHPEPLVSHLEEDNEYIVPLAVSFALLMAVFIIAAIFLYFVWRRRWCRKKPKKDNAKKPRVQLTETKQEGNNIPLFEKRGQSQVSTKPTSGWDESNSAVSVVSPVPQKSNEEPIREPDIELENSDNVNTQQLPGPYIKVPLTERSAFDTTSKDGSLKSDVGNEMEVPEHQVKSPVRRGIEIVTGWVYEEDPQTKVRNWIHTPIGEKSASFLPFNN
ncbi:protocadherin Fat 4-like [Ostrea edulis]|uniref:protocadherin Fat 4-like n=1 Tax=Ostrea edulis TaxID=37623 RepID=UPI0024AF49F0|nr:protocadherin Fat 4-like [Ostrea edulis]